MGHESRTKPAASRGCLRRGRSDSGMGGAPFASAGRSVASVVGLPSRPPSTQAEPSSRGPGRQGRSYSGALHLDALNHDRSTVCGPKADGMGTEVSGGMMAARSSLGHIHWRLIASTGCESAAQLRDFKQRVVEDFTRLARPVWRLNRLPVIS